MSVFGWFLIILLIVNTFGAIVTVLREVRDISTTWAWLLVLIFLPVIGFGLYLFAGRGLSARKLAAIEEEYDKGVSTFVALQKDENARRALLPAQVQTTAGQELATLFLNTASAPLVGGNTVKLFYDGDDKFASLFSDIKGAKQQILIEYYTIYKDELGNQLRDLLTQKANEGVEVKVLYDAWGSLGATAKWWQPLVDAGGLVETFFSSRHLFLDFRLNYRLHRKIVVIDSQVGYIGGFNVGDQYVSRSQKFGFWRDTHLRISGRSALALKVQFLIDWNATVPDKLEQSYGLTVTERAQASAHVGDTPMQIVSSGPSDDHQQIKYGYIKMITGASKRVWIQTPYLIPDDSVLDALTTAVLAGIDVRVMIPNMPDHPFIYRATQYYANQLVRLGVKIYHYQNGFLHAKTVVVDDTIASVGSANLDIRSFKLNFEANAFLYSSELNAELAAQFKRDLEESVELTEAAILQQGRWLTFKQYASRLLSPIL